MAGETSRDAGGCGRVVEAGDPALPVAGTGKLSMVRKSRNARLRAIVLIGLHLIIAVHITQYFVTGRTLSPVEPSESMYTLELGELNAGFVFFVVALLATLLFGRFVCGWGCHLVALQDFCGWLMKKVGIRPRPFRSRLMLWVPAGLAFYMFFWPAVRRWATRLLDRSGVLAALEQRDLLELLQELGLVVSAPVVSPPALSNHIMTDAFWKTFPSPLWTLVTLVTCGFVAVYLLGAKGFCAYGCPYGALFGAMDRFSPGRIVVSDACEQCGHCTATCTSNVIVHEEVRRFGMVVDPGCMKCMDCVSVCPKGALSFGFTRPSALKGQPRDKRHVERYALSLSEELFLLGVTIVAALSFRGLYDSFPLLMSVGLGAMTAFVVLKLWQLIRRPTVRVQNLKLKVAGRLGRSGWIFAALATLWILFTADSALAQWHRKWGAYYLNRTEAGRVEVLTGTFREREYSDDHHRATEKSLRHYRGADRWGLVDLVDVKLGLAWGYLLNDDFEAAEDEILAAVALDPDNRELHDNLTDIYLARGDLDGAVTALEGAVAADPSSAEHRFKLAGLYVQSSRYDDAEREYKACLELAPDSAEASYNLGGLLRRLGRAGEAVEYLSVAADLAPTDQATLIELGLAHAAVGRTPEALEVLQRAIEAAPNTPEAREYLPGLIQQLGQRPS